MLKCKIEIYTHFFKVSQIHPSMWVLLRKAFDELTQVSFIKIRGRFQKTKNKIYVAKGCDGSYRFHINYLSRFKQLLQDNLINWEVKEEVEWVRHEVHDGVSNDLTVVDGLTMYDYQQVGHDYAIADGYSKLITFSMGQGKTKCALEVGGTLKTRMLIMVLGRYTTKWVEDVQKGYGKNVKVSYVKGLSNLFHLLDIARSGGDIPDIIIVTTTIIQNYIKEWEEHAGVNIPDMVPPEDIYKVLGVGYRLVDEAHQHYHAVFKTDLYTHCPKTLYLTATLDTNDRFQNFIYQLMWPENTRCGKLVPPKYDETYALTYTHQHPERIRWKGQQGYSHVMYEQSIWKHIPSRCQYLDMIGDQVENWFLPLYEPGKKMLIFCALVDTCIDVAKYLSIRFKDQNWQISKFTAEDPKSVIDTNDITVSTLGKAGTALDVSGLVVCLMTNALAEPKANKQAKGRLRDLSKKPGFEHIVPKFLYFVATDLDKPLRYHLEKKQLFAPLTLKHVEQSIGNNIGKPMDEYLNFGKQGNWEAWGVDPNAKVKSLPPPTNKSNIPVHKRFFKPKWFRRH